MPQLVVHIGFAKTGTTSVQSALAMNSEALRSVGLHYPEPIERFGHNLLITPLRPVTNWMRPHQSKWSHEPEKPRRKAMKFLKNFKAELENNPDEIGVLSGEAFSPLQVEQIQILFEYLGVDPSDVLIICYIREPGDFWRASFEQRLKASTAVRHPFQGRYHFRAELHRWAHVVGHENVVVRDYTRDQLLGEDIVVDFMATLAQHTGRELKAPLQPPPATNISMGAEASILFQELRETLITAPNGQLTPESRKLSRAIRAAAAERATTRLSVAPDVLSAIASDYADDLRWLRRHHGIDYPQPDGGPDARSRAELEAMFERGRVREIVGSYDSDVLEAMRTDALAEMATYDIRPSVEAAL